MFRYVSGKAGVWHMNCPYSVCSVDCVSFKCVISSCILVDLRDCSILVKSIVLFGISLLLQVNEGIVQCLCIS